MNALVGSLCIFVNFRKSGTQKGSTGVFKESQVVPARSAEVGWAAAVTSPSNCLIIQHKLDPKNSPLTIRIKVSSVSKRLKSKCPHRPPILEPTTAPNPEAPPEPNRKPNHKSTPDRRTDAQTIPRTKIRPPLCVSIYPTSSIRPPNRTTRHPNRNFEPNPRE